MHRSHLTDRKQSRAAFSATCKGTLFKSDRSLTAFSFIFTICSSTVSVYLRWRNRDETVIALPNCLCRLHSDGAIAVFVHHSVISRRVGYSILIGATTTCRRCALLLLILLLVLLLIGGLIYSLRFGGKSCDCCGSGGWSELVGRIGHLGGNPPTIATTFLLLVHTWVLRGCIIQHVLLLELRQWDTYNICLT